jgi:hypothetical protein
MRRFVTRYQVIIMLMVTLVTLMLIYRTTLLTQISGGRDASGEISPYMDDVGEMQVALNVWGTIHHTGYPLFTILGNITTTLLRAIGIEAVTAPTIYALLWGFAALSILYVLLNRLTGRPEIAGSVALLVGMARSVWIHNVIAEVYSMSLAIMALLLAIALWPTAKMGRGRILLLALVGGIGVGHHRLIALMAPGLLLAVWPVLRTEGRRVIATVATAVLIGLIGFVPYIYLPLRALAGGEWVYGDPSTLQGFWHEFSGAEAAFLMQAPAGTEGLISDFVDTLTIIGTELGVGLAVVSVAGCLFALIRPRFRREMVIALACVLPTFIYLVVQHRVVMPQATAMPIVMVLLFGLGLGTATVIEMMMEHTRLALVAIIVATGLYGQSMLARSIMFIRGLTHDQTGVQIIEMASHIPREGGRTVLWLPWGPNFTAVAFSKYVTWQNADLNIATHLADVRTLVGEGKQIVTAKDVLYRFGIEYWEERLGRVYLSSAADDVIAIRTMPLEADNTHDVTEVAYGVVLRTVSACTRGDEIHVTAAWGATRTPDKDLSVFVHLLDAENPIPLTQADSTHPVYGWYPTSRWSAGEVVYDNYRLARLPNGARVAIGMYEQINGMFENYGTTIVPVNDALPCS